MEVILRAEDPFELTIGNEHAPPDNQRVQLGEYRRRKGKAIALIFGSCTTSAQQYLDGLTDPGEMWTLLAKKLNTVASRAGRMATLRQFSRSRPVLGKPITEYISTLLYFRDILSGTEEPITDSAFISHVLMTLPASFDTFSDILLGQRTVDELIVKIKETEDTLNTRQADYRTTDMSRTLTAPKALTARAYTPRGRFRGKGKCGKQSTERRNNNLLCWYCTKKGHKEENCYTKKKAEDAREDRLGRRSRKRESGIVESAGAAYASVQALAAGIGRNPGKAEWIIDSGASHHLCRKRSYFVKIKHLQKPILVHLGDGSAVPAIAAGTICLPLLSRVISIEALFVPRLQTSLLSVSQLSKTYEITFKNSTCFLEGSRLGLLADGIYRFVPQKQQIPVGNSMTRCVQANSALLPSIDLWHQRLAHLSHKTLRTLLPQSAYSGSMPTESVPCEICVKSKHQRKFERKPAPRASSPFELLHSDLCGPIIPESASGARYFILYIDDFSRTTWVYFLQSKTATEIASVFEEFKARVEKRFPKYPIVRFRCDNGKGEYDNNLFRGILRLSGILFEPSPPYTQHKNGVSERMIRTIVTKARALLLDSCLGEEFWAEAVNTAVYLHARSPSRTVGGLTPYEKLFGVKPELGHLRRFGCTAYKLIPEAQRDGKFRERAKKCVFLGYVHDTVSLWRLWDPESKRVIQASDVRFAESETMGELEVDKEQDLEVLRSCIPDGKLEEDDGSTPMKDVIRVIAPNTLGNMVNDCTTTQEAIEPSGTTPTNSGSFTEVPKTAGTTAVSDLRSRNIQAPLLRRSARHGGSAHAHKAVLEPGASDKAESDPLSYREALEHSCNAAWKEAMGAEFRSLVENNTWTYCSIVPVGAHPIGCKWVYVLKSNPDGSRRFKARLVIKGYQQTDIGETYAPVAKLVSLRMIIALAASNGWELDHMDVVTAFLNPPVKDDIYMLLPEGIEWLDPSKPACSTVCRLNKALYGLKEAPRLWYQHIDEFILSIGFRKSVNDPNVYLSLDHQLILLLYVDDLLLAARNRSQIDQAKALLRSRYQMSDLGPARKFLGLEIDRLPNGSLKLHQTQFMLKVLQRFSMQDCNGVHTPMEAGRKLVAANDHDKLIEPGEYQSLVGSLMYIAVGTRPDLAFSISTLSKFNSKPTTAHLLATKRVLRYLKETLGLGLVYGTVDNLIGYTDSDFAGDLDDRKSTSGYVFSISGAAVSWKSKKQSLVSLSSTEAEYIACSEAIREGIWLRRLYQEIISGQSSPSNHTIQLILSDSQGAICLAKSPGFNNRTKHIDVKYHFVQDALAQGLIQLDYLPTRDMPADIITKALPRDTHLRHVRGMGLQEGD